MTETKYAYSVSWDERLQRHIGKCLEWSDTVFISADGPRHALDGIVTMVRLKIEDLQARGEKPSQPFSLRYFKGDISVRVPPERHRVLMEEAVENGLSLNELINQKLSR